MAHMGYEHVVDWLNSNATRRGDVSDIRSDEDLDQDHEEMADPDRAETFGDIVSVPEMDEQGAPIDQVRTKMGVESAVHRMIFRHLNSVTS